MRVVFIARYLQMVNHRKVLALAAQPGLELWHVAPRRWTDSFRTYEQELSQGRGYHLLLADAFPLRDDSHRFIYRPPTLYLNRILPDVIHIEEEPDSLAALEAAVARRIWAPSARLVLFTWQNVRRTRHAAVERIARYVLRRTDHVIAGNREAIEVLQQQGYTGPATVIPQLGVDTSIFRPRDDAASLRSELGLNGFVTGYVGRFVQEKGLDVLLKAAARMQDSRVLLIGRGPLQAEIETMAESLGMRQRLTILPALPHQDVPRYLTALDVLVLPSRTTAWWKEQFGHVLIEAMACGTPVVGSDSGAIPEVIGTAGLVFPEGDADALAQRLQALAHGPDQRARLIRLGSARVAQHYTHERIAEQTARVYESLARPSRP